MEHERILTFWFSEIKQEDWWRKNPVVDQEIRKRFSDIYSRACKVELFFWRDSPAGRLAEIITLDQFSRHLHRNSPKSFAQGHLALALSQEALRSEAHAGLTPHEKAFLYMPFMHSESLLIQRKSVELFSGLGLKENLEYAILHKNIIERFGRFPHRNKLMQRTSSPEEIEFLKEPGSSF